MLPPGCMRAACYLAAHGVLRGYPWDRSSPRRQGLPTWSLTGQVARCGFVVTEGKLRGTDFPRAAAGSAGPALRVLLTIVACLSNRSRKHPAACCTAAFLTPALPAVPSCSQLVDGSLVLGPGRG